MKLQKDFKVGDTIRFNFFGEIKEGKLRDEPSIVTEELSELYYGALPIGKYYYVIETTELDENGIIIDNVITEDDIL